jgi:hypothetical protein
MKIRKQPNPTGGIYVLIRLSDPESSEPFSVCVVHENGDEGHPCLNKSLRDARIYANGVSAGVGVVSQYVPIRMDDRLAEQADLERDPAFYIKVNQ